MAMSLILSADKWSMPDERTGEVRSGVTVWCVDNYRSDSADSLGYKPVKLSVDSKIFPVLEKSGLPGLYHVDLALRPGKEAKPTPTVVGVRLERVIPFFALTKVAGVAA
jgi:hypothetical protein